MKGQNLRILTYDSTASKYKCVGMATNCVITLTGNSDDASTKDDVGLASKPEITSKGWSVQVDSLNVADVPDMLTAIKSMTPFTLIWDETATTDNQTAQGNSFARGGTAYLSDGTFQFNDRENSSKSLTFTGSSALSAVSSPSTATVAAGSYTKGQFVRLFLGSDNNTTPAKVIGGAKTLSLHISMTMESVTTKDTTGDWDIQEPTALSYDISTNALVSSGESITSSVDGQTLANLETIYESSSPVKWQIAKVSSTNNRTKGDVLVEGSCIVTQLTINAQNRTTATYDAQLTGYGVYSVPSNEDDPERP